MRPIGDICRDIAERLGLDLSSQPSEAYNIDKIFDELDGVVCVATRSGMGKTTFLLDVALERAMHSEGAVVIITCEKATEQIVSQLVMKLCGLSICFMNDEKKQKLAQAFVFLSRLNIYIKEYDPEELPEISEIETLVSEVDNVGLVMIDGLYCVWDEVPLKNSDRRVKQLKAISQKVNAPIIITTYYERSEIKKMLAGNMSKNFLLKVGFDKIVVLYRSMLGTTMSPTANYLIVDPNGRYKLSTLQYDSKRRLFSRNA